MTEKELLFKQLKREDSGCVTYLVGSQKTRECVIVDPLLDVDFIIEKTRNAGFDKITGIIDTHTHADHISGARRLVKKFDLEGVMMHIDSKCNFQTIPIRDGQVISVGDVTLQFIHTPGHTLDHVCILVDGTKVLTGDTLLIGDVGRIDLGGNLREKAEKLYDSLYKKLLKLEDSTQVYPTHVGSAHHLNNSASFSSIGNEKSNNPALKIENVDAFYKYMTEDWPPKPPDYQNIIKLNRGEIMTDV